MSDTAEQQRTIARRQLDPALALLGSIPSTPDADEDPVQISRRKQDEHEFHPPLDIVDGAVRIVDPIFDGLNPGEHIWV